MWLDFPFDHEGFSLGVSLGLQRVEGAFDVDLALLAAGREVLPLPGEETYWDAARLFRAGYSFEEGEGVLLRRSRDQADTIFYGPHLPMAAGEYEIVLDYHSEAEAGTLLGRLDAGSNVSRGVTGIDVRQGERAVVRYRHVENLPLRVEFTFSGATDVLLKGVLCRRLK